MEICFEIKVSTDLELVEDRLYGETWRLKPNMMFWLYTIVVKLMVSHSILVLRSKMKHSIAINRLGRVQRLSCPGIAGAMTTPTAPLRILLNFPLLHLLIRGARIVQFRLENSRSYKGSDKPEITEFVDKRHVHIPNCTFNITVKNTKCEESENMHGRKVWYTDGSKSQYGP